MSGYASRPTLACVHCQRPVKEDGLCAQHLAGRKRSDAQRAKRAEKRAADEAVKEHVDAQIAELKARGLTKASADWNPVGWRYTGLVIVDPDELLRLLGTPQ